MYHTGGCSSKFSPLNFSLLLSNSAAITLPNKERNTDKLATDNAYPSDLSTSFSHSALIAVVDIFTEEVVDSAVTVVDATVVEATSQSSGRNALYMGPIIIRLTADPTRTIDNCKPNARFKAFPANQAEQYVLHATAKFSPASPKTNLPVYTTILPSKKAPAAVNT